MKQSIKKLISMKFKLKYIRENEQLLKILIDDSKNLLVIIENGFSKILKIYELSTYF